MLHVNACYAEFVRTRNVTLALPEELLGRLRVIAAQQDTSISAMLTASLQQLADQEQGYSEAHRGMMEDMRRGYDLGTGGKITWTRESLYER